MKALHLIKTGLGATWALRQIEVLIGHGIEVHVALGEDGPMAARYDAAGAAVHRLPVDLARIGPRDYPAAARDLQSLADRLQPEVIHSHFLGTTLFARFALGRTAKVPRIFQVPGPLHLEKTMTRIADLRSAGSRDHFVASCRLTREIYLRGGVPPERVSLSYYGTDVDEFSPVDPDPVIRDRIGVPPGAEVVGMVAFMYPPKRLFGQRTGLKGHEDLIEALGLLRDRGRNVAGVFVGGAWGQAHRYEAAVRRLGGARLGRHGVFLGTRADVRALYASFDLVAHPSHSENLGGAAESLLLGVPTIATNVGGFPDIVQHGKTGILVPPHAPPALAEAIAAMLDDPARARAMARAGRALTSKLMDVRRTGAEIVRLYERVVAA